MTTRKYHWRNLVYQLIKVLKDNPKGLTKTQIAKKLDITETTAKTLVSLTRNALAESSANIVWNPAQGRYILVGESDLSDLYRTTNVRHIVTRLRTVRSFYELQAKAAPENSAEGRSALYVLKLVDRILEDMRFLA